MNGFLLTQRMKIVFKEVNETATAPSPICNPTYNNVNVMHKYERVCLTGTVFMQITFISCDCCFMLICNMNTEHERFFTHLIPGS